MTVTKMTFELQSELQTQTFTTKTHSINIMAKPKLANLTFDPILSNQ